MIPHFGRREAGAPTVPRRAAYAVVLNEDLEVLVVHTVSGLFLPGGGAHLDEAPRETVVREVEEEKGCEVSVGTHLATAKQYFSSGDTRYAGDFDFFLCAIVRDGVGPAEHDFSWIPAVGSDGRFFHESHAWAIERALARARGSRRDSRRSRRLGG